jgi:hypothetical protein
MSNYAKRYSKEFEEEAVRLLATSGKTAAEPQVIPMQCSRLSWTAVPFKF